MDTVTSQTACYDTETRDLKMLLEVFGSMCSLEDISSAYCEALRNIDGASEILCALHGKTSGGAGCSSMDKLEGAIAASSLDLSSSLDRTSEMQSRLSSDNVLQKPFNGEGSTRASKSKAIPVSVGTVSGVIGKEYIRPRSSKNQSKDATKPLKLDSNQFSVSQVWNEEVQMEKNSKMHTVVEEFLFRMLSDGFQFDMTVIREVLGTCGYDVQKSMDKLFSMSASTLNKCEDDVGLVAKKATGKLQDEYHSLCGGVASKTGNLTESPKRDNNRLDLQKEVLESLFHASERSEEAPKRTIPVRKVRPRASGKLVVAPLGDSSTKEKTVSVKPQEVARDEDEDYENSYEFLRKAVKEYWNTMKEYYKSAFDAFVKDDYELAEKLLEKGHFFNRKAREADEKSAEKLLEKTRDDEVSLDLRFHEPKEALRLLRLHLTSFSGIFDFKQLKVIVGTDEADTKKRARKRLIVKQLEKESIKWTEEVNGETMLIPLDVIDPKRLSFSKK
uniref:putative nuclear RNA export factor SDE5 isoform X1 n=1 Tax=Ziziphus jujuba TaxID=326968 RepID=A0A6P4ATX7_ZIZJJ